MMDLTAYHQAAQPIVEKYMVPMVMFGKPNGRRLIPSEDYASFLEELRPVWEEHIGSWPEIWC